MILYPAMDLMGGRVVRLAQGRFDDATIYPADPAAALATFAAAGAAWAHVVDLDGARAGAPVQHDLIARLASESPLSLQVAGGIRTRDQIARLLDAGAARIVVGSVAVNHPERVLRWLEEFGGERITLAFDVKVEGGVPLVYAAGWLQATGLDAVTMARRYTGGRHLLVTDIDRDGMLRGPNFPLLEELAERLPEYAIQASGGITSLGDLQRLHTAGAIVGRALWEGRIDLRQALDACA
jgi:phosphoribosylformimino-5-aminoimidazole carboxamide ribotide isomerase